MDSERLDKLAEATLQLSLNFRSDSECEEGFDEIYERYFPSLESEPAVEALQEDEARPGLLCRIEKGAGTFCVRAHLSDDLGEAQEYYEQRDALVLKDLKLEGEEDEVFCFPTEELVHAEVIRDQLVNRRFPIEEDLLCNLSDPGFSWWLDRDEGEITIYFSSHGLDRAHRYTKLGPLGDPRLAELRFRELYPWLRSMMPLAAFSCTPKQLQIKISDPQHPSCERLWSLLSEGEFGWSEQELEGLQRWPRHRGATLIYYLRELAVLRRFWKEIEARL